MLLEEQFERLAADVSAGAADKAADIRYTRAFFIGNLSIQNLAQIANFE